MATHLCIYYAEKQHKQALCEGDKQAATKLLSASRATNLCIVANRDYKLCEEERNFKRNY